MHLFSRALAPQEEGQIQTGAAKSKGPQPDQVKAVLQQLVELEFAWNDRYASDFCRDFYSAQGGVTPLLSQYN